MSRRPFFDTFERRTRIEATLECVTAMRIGVGKSADAASTDLPVLCGWDGHPFIPGSSLKGVIRSQLESILRGFGLKVCDPIVDPCFGDEDRRRIDKDSGTAQERSKNVRAYLESDDICAICRVFGLNGLASHVVFADAKARPETYHTEVRDGVSLDRDLGRVSGGRKFDLQVVTAGSQFDLRVEMEDLDEADEGLVVLGLDLIHEGVARVGGAKSRGLGVMKMSDWKVSEWTRESIRRGRADTLDWTEFREKRLNAFRERYALAAGR